MLKSRSKSVDLLLDQTDPDDNLLRNYSWKTNFLCGVYKKEMTSSIFYIKNTPIERYVVRGEESINDTPEAVDNGEENRSEDGRARKDHWRMQKYSAVMKKTVMNVVSAKHEVTVVSVDNETKNTRTLSEKYSQGTKDEYCGKNSNLKLKTDRQNYQAKHFQRKYLTS